MKDRGAWLPAAHGVTKNWAWLSNWTPPPPPSKGYALNHSRNLEGNRSYWLKPQVCHVQHEKVAIPLIWLCPSLNWHNYSNVLDILWTLNKWDYETHKTHHRRWIQLTSSFGGRLSAVTSPSEQVLNKSCLMMAMMTFSLFYESFLKHHRTLLSNITKKDEQLAVIFPFLPFLEKIIKA